MSGLILILLIIVVIAILVYTFTNQGSKIRYITSYQFPNGLRNKISDKYPHLSENDTDLVLNCLRDYFVFCLQANFKMVAMPSQVVDVAWHEFILYTRQYQEFCTKALYRFLHHTPTDAMSSPTVADEGIKRVWRLACARDTIQAGKPDRLPLLFSIDTQLNIKDGFTYSLECKDKSSPNYGTGFCAGHISCVSGCGGDSRFFVSSEHASESSSSNFSSDVGGHGCGGDSGGGGGGD